VHVVAHPDELASSSRRWQTTGETVGIVPTMGALHLGHSTLIEAARSVADRVVVSIFVNPIQFDDRRDFEAYPDTFDDDLAMCRSLGVDVVYRPTVDVMYPPGFATSVRVAGLTDRWEGADRPGHFDGVTTVVTKLFTASRADLAFFGRKDFQQAAVVRRMARDLDLPIDVRVCPTVRDSDGLALSSRNRRLSTSARRRALAIPAALDLVENEVGRGLRDVEGLRRSAVDVLQKSDLVVHYLAIVDPDSLDPVETARSGDVVLVAATCDGVRLIDNVSIA
jgi:pantoate--beta-alanine ligase